jgi:hypothetical protein
VINVDQFFFGTKRHVIESDGDDDAVGRVLASIGVHSLKPGLNQRRPPPFSAHPDACISSHPLNPHPLPRARLPPHDLSAAVRRRFGPLLVLPFSLRIAPHRQTLAAAYTMHGSTSRSCARLHRVQGCLCAVLRRLRGPTPPFPHGLRLIDKP